MATSSGLGFDLEDVVKKAEEADKILEKMVDRSAELSKNMTQAFKAGTTNDVSRLTADLQKLQSMLSFIGNNQISLNVNDDKLKQAEDALNHIVNLANYISKGGISLFNGASDLNELNEINAALRRFNEAVDKERNRIQGGSSSSTELAQLRAYYQEEERLAQQQLKNDRKRTKEFIDNIKRRTDIQRRWDERKNTRYDGAMQYSKEAKTINDLQKAIKYLDEARRKEDQSTKRGRVNYQQLTAEMNRQQKKYDELTQSINRYGSSMLNIGQQIQRATALMFSVSAIRGYIGKLMAVRGEFELQQRSLQAILQNKDEADRLWDKTVALAVRSPFTVRQLVTYTKQLAAYRIEADKLYETNKMLADISSGLGVDMQRLILAYGQVKAANYLRGTELRQFSEAGVNVLGELAERFTELEGRAVSVGDVFERVSKRMVSFADVDAVLKKLTSEGGIFYNMQEIQAETLRGQMLNLKDSIDLMFNEIGQDSDGVLKGSVALVRSLVEHWKTFAVILKVVVGAFALYRARLLWTNSAMGKYIAMQRAMATSTTAFGRALEITKATLIRFGAAMKSFMASNIWLLAIAGLAEGIMSVIGALNKQNKAIREAEDRYFEQVAAMDKLEKSYDKIIAKEKSLTNVQKTDANVTNEIYDEKVKQLDELLEYAKSQSITISVNVENPTKENIDNIIQQVQDEIYNILELNSIFNETLAKHKTDTIGPGETLETDWKQLEETTRSLMGYETALKKVWNEITTLKKQGKISDIWDIDQLEQGEDESDIDFIIRKIKYTKQATEQINKLNGIEIKNIDRINKLYDNSEKYLSRKKEAIEEMSDLIASTLEAAGEEDLSHLAKEQQMSFLDNVIKEFSKVVTNEAVLEMARRLAIEKFHLNLVVDVEAVDKNNLSAWQKAYNEYIKTIKGGYHLAEAQDPLVGREDLAERLKTLNKEDAKLKQELIKKVPGAIADFSDQKAIDAEIAKLTEAIQARKEAIAWLGGGKDSNGKQKDIEKEALNERISLIKKLISEYEKLRKTKSAEEAVSLLRNNEEYKLLASSLGISDILDSLVVDSMGNINIEEFATTAFDKIIGRLSREDLQKKAMKAKADYEVEIGIKDEEEAIKNLNKDISDLFDRFDLTKEVEKIGVDKNLIKMLDVEPLTLDQLKTEIQSLYIEAKRLGKDGEKEYENALKRITDLENNNAKERMKNYVKYLTESVGQRAQIEIIAMRDINKIRQDETLDAFSKEQAILQRQKKMQEDLTNYDFDQFKSSDVYVETFKDLERASKEQLQYVINKLKELQSVNKDLSPTQVKAMAQEIKKAEDALADLNAFDNIGGNIKEAIKYHRERKELLKQQVALQAELDAIEATQTEQEKKLVQLTEKRDSIKNKESKEWKDANIEVEKQQALLSGTNNIIDSTVEKLKELGIKIEIGEQAIKALSSTFGKVGQYANEASSVIPQIAGDLENVFGAMSDGTKDTIDSISEILGGIGQMSEGIARIAKNPADIGGWFQAVGGLAKTIGSIFAIGDKKKERQIKKEIKLVERLQKTYEELEESIQNAYDIDTYEATYEEAKQNLQNQIDATQRMIALELDKKNVDEERIEEWQEQIEEYNEQLKELEEQRTEELGGLGSKSNYKSAAEGFVDAWIEAFKETEDGLEGLEEHFDEFLEDMLKKQLLQRAAGKFLEPFFEKFDQMFAEDSAGGGKVMRSELDKIKQEFSKLAPEFSATMEEIINELGIVLGGSEAGELGELTKGIQGITEQQAEVIQSYLNSIRMYVSDSNQQLKDQTKYLRSLWQFFDGMSANSQNTGGKGIKVYIQ